MNVARVTFLVSSITMLCFATSPAMAQVSAIQGGLNAAAGTSYGSTKVDENTLPKAIGTIINVVLQMVGVLLLGYLLYAGFLWMTAGGDKDKVEAAQKTIKNVVFGLLIIVLAYAIAGYVLSKLGEIATGSDANSVSPPTVTPSGGGNTPCTTLDNMGNLVPC